MEKFIIIIYQKDLHKICLRKLTYTNTITIAIAKNGGWIYRYWNQFYIELVLRYIGINEFSNKTVQISINEALNNYEKNF